MQLDLPEYQIQQDEAVYSISLSLKRYEGPETVLYDIELLHRC